MVALEMGPSHIDFSSNPSLGKAAFMAFNIDDCLEEIKETSINMRSSHHKNNNPSPVRWALPNDLTGATDETCPVEQSNEYWGAVNPPPNILVHLDEETI